MTISNVIKNTPSVEAWAERILNHDLNNPNMHNKFAFYGSLRKDLYNYNALVKPAIASGKAEEKGTAILDGYKMFSFGSYPFVVSSDSKDDKITVELYELNDPYYVSRIHGMETGAGYAVEEVTINNEVYWLYVYRDGVNYASRGFEQVKDGNWTNFVSKGLNYKSYY